MGEQSQPVAGRTDVIITCPNCQTRYRVAADAVSAAGRQVQCANCATLWVATPTFPPPPSISDPEPDSDELTFRADTDAVFTPGQEEMADAAFEKQDQPAPALRPRDRGLDAKLVRERMDEMAKRRNAVISKLPLARFRRAARYLIAATIALTLIGAITMRTEIVRHYPQFDGLFRIVGLGTNVMGLDITDLKTLRTTRDGNPVIVVTAKISNITNRVAYVPNVLVSLLDADQREIYEWSVTPSARNILPGDVLSVDTQLISPPQGVDAVRLRFVDATGRTDSD